jgi:hypothetical protein
MSGLSIGTPVCEPKQTCRGFLVRSAAVLLLSGCAQLEAETYPDSWPPINVVGGSCPDIAGQYGFEAEHPRDFQAERALTTLHELAGFQSVLPVPNRIVISHNDDKWFRIQAFVDNKLTLTREFSSANATIRCEATGLFLKPPPLEQKIDGGSQTIRRELLFNTAKDGSLVFREEYTATSRILLAPVAGSGTRWNRLDRVRP